MTEFSILALIEAGTVRENDDTLAIMQNISRSHAHTIARWLALTTNTPAHLRYIGLDGSEEIRYTPEQVRAGIVRVHNGPPPAEGEQR